MRFGRNSESFFFLLCIILHLVDFVHIHPVFFFSFFFFHLFHLLDLVHTWVLVLGLVLGSRFSVLSSVLRRMPQHGIMIDLDCPWSFSFCLLFFFIFIFFIFLGNIFFDLLVFLVEEPT